MPEVEVTVYVKVKCPKCGHEHEVEHTEYVEVEREHGEPIPWEDLD